MNRKAVLFAFLFLLVATPGWAWLSATYDERYPIINSSTFTGILYFDNSTNYYGTPIGINNEVLYLYNSTTTNVQAVGNDTTEYCFADSVRRISTCATGDIGMELYLSLDDVSGIAWDMNNKHNGTVSGTPTREVAGKINTAYDFDGTSDYITIPDHADINFGTTDSFTISVWFKSTDSGTYAEIFEKQDGTPMYQATMTDGAAEDSLDCNIRGTNNNLVTASLTWSNYNDGNWHHLVMVRSVAYDKLMVFMDGVNLVNATDTTTGTLSNTATLKIATGNNPGSPLAATLDDFRLYREALTSVDIANLYVSGHTTYLGEQQGTAALSYDYTPTYPYINDSINFTATWEVGTFNDFWWNLSLTNQTFYTTENTTEFSGFSTTGSKNVTLIGYDSDTSANFSSSKTVTVYDNITGVVVGISSYLPFIAVEPTITLNYTTTGGAPTVNSSWTITLPDATTNTSVVNQTSFTYALTQSDIHTAAVTVCDLGNDVCVTNSSQFKAWNVTSDVHLHTPFNATSDSLAEAFYGDYVPFTSTGVLNWGLDGELKEGTTTSWTLGSTNGFWSSDDYIHYRFTVNNSWGTYVSNQSFTAIVALYNMSVGCVNYRTPYCYILAEIFNINGTQISDAGNTYDYFLTNTEAYGHDNQTINTYTGANLNLSLCLNATPLLSSFTLDGTIAYAAVNYTGSSYAFDAADMDFVTSCTYANSHRYKFYVIPNSTTTYDTTFIIQQSGTALTGALVKIQAQVGGNWVVIGSGITDVNGKVAFPLRQCYIYYKIIVEQAGETLHESAVTCLKASECTTTTCERVIEVDTVVQEWYSVQAGISSACEYVSTEDYFKCTISDPDGKGLSSTLDIYMLTSNTPICTESESSSTTTLICSTSGWLDGPYKFSLHVSTSGTTYLIGSGGFSIGSETTLGAEGPIVALALLLTLVFAVSKISPVVVVVVSSFGFVLLSVLKLISVGYFTIGWIIAMALIAIIRGMSK